MKDNRPHIVSSKPLVLEHSDRSRATIHYFDSSRRHPRLLEVSRGEDSAQVSFDLDTSIEGRESVGFAFIHFRQEFAKNGYDAVGVFDSRLVLFEQDLPNLEGVFLKYDDFRRRVANPLKSKIPSELSEEVQNILSDEIEELFREEGLTLRGMSRLAHLVVTTSPFIGGEEEISAIHYADFVDTLNSICTTFFPGLPEDFFILPGHR